MRIGILSRNPALYSTRRLVEAARQRSHSVRVLDTLQLLTNLALTFTFPSPWKGEGPGGRVTLDALIPRIGASNTLPGLAVVQHFERLGIFTTAPAAAIAHSRDKAASFDLMRRHGLPTPRTAVIHRPEELRSALLRIGGPPVVLKPTQGTQGNGVILAYTPEAAEAVLATFWKPTPNLPLPAPNPQPLVPILIQEFIEEAQGQDWRILVVDGRPLAAMRRTAADGDFRANLHRGGAATPISLNETTKRLAQTAARIHGLAVAGVDLIPSRRGPLLLEVNSSPGLEGIERVTGVDVAAAIVRYLERAVKQRP